MNPLETSLRRSKLHPMTFVGGILLAAGVFISMGLTQLKVEYTPPEAPAPLLQFHLPPPPPPPPAKIPPKKTAVSINFNLPATSGPADVPLGFLDIDFGLSPKKLTQATVSVSETIDNYQTEGVEDLTVYDYADVTEKPEATYNPPLDIPGKLIGNTTKPVTFTYLCRVDTSGRATDIHIIETNYPEAVPFLIKYVQGIRFAPAKKDGKKVNCLVQRKTTYTPASNKSPFDV